MCAFFFIEVVVFVIKDDERSIKSECGVVMSSGVPLKI